MLDGCIGLAQEMERMRGELAELLQRKQAEANAAAEMDAMEGSTSPAEPKFSIDPEAIRAMNSGSSGCAIVGVMACVLIGLVVASAFSASRGHQMLDHHF